MLPIKRNGSKCTTAYTYETASDGGQTGRVKTVKNGSHSENYTYDTWGNVTKVTENSSQTGKAYAYDAQGQLIREYDPDQKVWLGYKYDAGGNMTEVRSYPAAENGSPEGDGTVIKKFVYGSAWKDQLTAMTVDGTIRNFTYDANGNLLSDGKYTYSWTKGSLLEKVTGDGLEAVYTYDASGIRTSKKVNGITTEYLTAGGSVLSEKKNGVWQHYLYDGSGQLTAIRYKGADYYYVRNGLMTIMGLVDANGTAVVNYFYDSWGRMLNITGSLAASLGKDNPYRFKGYYYDDETRMYYLKSRYYQPEICRFISADTIEVLDCQGDLNDKNLYAYCDNNPVMRVDTGGQIWITLGIMAAGGGIGMVIGAASSAITQYMFNGEINWKSVWVAAVGGFVSGAVAASPLGLTGQIGVGAAVGAVSYVADCKVNGSALKVDELAVSAAAGAVSGGIGGSGANQYKALSNTIKTASKTTARFTRLISTKGSASLAAKRIAEAKMWRDTVLKGTTWISSIKFAAGTGTSNVIAQLWTKAKNKVRSWFK
ncbi:MAG: RHS repeat domain-containing protein [Coprococcus sp.]